MSRRAPLHVLDGVLRWPPETFIRGKLEALAGHGVRVTAASTVPRAKATTRLRGVALLRVPGSRERQLVKLAGTVWDLLVLLRRPARLRALVLAVRAPWPPARATPSWATTVSLLRRYARLARQRADIVHFEWETVAGHYLPLMEVWDVPVVMSCRGRALEVQPHVPGSESWMARLPLAFSRAAAVHCVSEATRDHAVGFGLQLAKACVIRPAVDTEFFQPPAVRPPAARLRVLSVGALIWVKGHEYGLAVIDDLVRRGIPVGLQIAGEGPDRDRIAATVADLGLEDHVELVGRLDPPAIRARLHETDVLLHASLAEGIPNVVLEAMACGVPPVVTDVGGTREAVRDGREGFLVAARDIERMAAGLETLWTDPDRRARMGRAARQRVEAGFALAQQVPRILALYERVLNPSDREMAGEPG